MKTIYQDDECIQSLSLSPVGRASVVEYGLDVSETCSQARIGLVGFSPARSDLARAHLVEFGLYSANTNEIQRYHPLPVRQVCRCVGNAVFH